MRDSGTELPGNQSERGRTLQLKFENECSIDESWFLKPIARTKILLRRIESDPRELEH
jgi:hypothetical protein